MESSLHCQLKEWLGPGAGGRAEVAVAGFRVDAVEADGGLIEIQTGALGPLRAKLDLLLPGHRVRVVKPVVLARRLVRRSRRDGTDLSARLSPKRGAVCDVFDDLIGLAAVFPHPHLSIDVLGVEVDEVRVPRRRWPGYAVADRRLRRVVSSVTLREPGDLWRLLPAAPPLHGPFTTGDLAARLDRPLAFAQRVAYCLRLAGAVETLGKSGNSRVYAVPTSGPGPSLSPDPETEVEMPPVVPESSLT
jgi:hypothetical protein